MTASTQQRREAILAVAYEKGRLSVHDLAAHLGISEATARRDLKTLAGDGELELVHGGATLRRPADFSFRSKAVRNIEAKRAIGRLAAQLVGDNDQVFLDSGTTCFQMAPYLKRRQGLSVVANSSRLAAELDAPGTLVILLGGQYRPERADTIGPLATRTLENLRGYTAFIGADGLCPDFGLTASDIESAHLYALAVANARDTVLLADHSKFLSPSLYKIVGFDAVSRVITDRAPDDAWVAFFEARGIDLIYPSEAQP
jgi:DeoR family transcriptional regulator of aga operon